MVINKAVVNTKGFEIEAKEKQDEDVVETLYFDLQRRKVDISFEMYGFKEDV